MPLEGVRDADAQGAEALTVALDEIVEELTPGGELASVYVHRGVMVVIVGLMPQFSHGLAALLSEPRLFASA